MRRSSAQRGEGNLGCILWLVVFLVVAMIGWKAIPVKIQSAELYYYMVELAKFSAANSPEKLEKQILQRAKELDIPLDKDDVEVQRVGDRIRMKASYTVPLEFPGYTYEWDFDHEVDRPIFIF